MKRLLILLAAWAVLGGCGGSPPVPTDHYYRLPAPQVSGAATDLAPGPIYVERFLADGVLTERAIAYTQDADATEVRQHHYHHWVDSPTRLVRDHLIDWLRADRAAPLVSAAPDVDAELSLFGKIRRFEIVHGRGSGEVVVELEFRVEKRDRDTPLLIERYTERVPLRSDSIGTAVDGFGAALSAIYARLSGDIRSRL
jgi:ABC-type uncharacterized transport system auxiliary subunit